MSTQTITFNSASELSFDTALVEVSGSVVRLKDLGGATYSTAQPPVRTQHRVLASSISGLSATLSEPALTSVKWQITIDGVAYYWSGDTLLWTQATSSAGGVSFSETSSLSELSTNLGTLLSELAITGSFALGFIVFLKSNNGTARPSVTSITVTYALTYLAGSSISECAISGNVINLLGDAYNPGSSTPAKLCIKNGRSFMHGNKLVLPFEKTATVGSDGTFSIQVIETETVAEKLEIYLQYYENSSLRVIRFIPAMIPNSPTRTLDQVSDVDTQCFG